MFDFKGRVVGEGVVGGGGERLGGGAVTTNYRFRCFRRLDSTFASYERNIRTVESVKTPVSLHTRGALRHCGRCWVCDDAAYFQ